jgi:hypothetical protein
MRHRAAFALMISMLLLTACGGRTEINAAQEFQNKLAAAQSVSFTSSVRAEYDDRTVEYTLDYSLNSGGETVEVKKPELIAGIKAHVDEKTSKLEYDGAYLDTGPLPGDLSPLSALPELTKAMKTGHIDTAWREGDATAAEITPRDGITVTVWFDENMNPYHAEIQSAGKVQVYCDIINYKFS